MNKTNSLIQEYPLPIDRRTAFLMAVETAACALGLVAIWGYYGEPEYSNLMWAAGTSFMPVLWSLGGKYWKKQNATTVNYSYAAAAFITALFLIQGIDTHIYDIYMSAGMVLSLNLLHKHQTHRHHQKQQELFR